MIALLLAAQLSAIVAASPQLPLVQRPRNFVEAPVICRNEGAMQTSYTSPALLMRPQDWAQARPRRLGDLPKANKEIAVLRTIGGCAVPVGVAYQIEGDGRFADDASRQLTREDAPSNRR